MSDAEEPWRDTVRYWPQGWREHMRTAHRPRYFAIPFIVFGLAGVLVGLFCPLTTMLITGSYAMIIFCGLWSFTFGTAKWPRRTVRRWRIRELPDGRSVLFAPGARSVWWTRAATLSIGAVAAFLVRPLLGPIEGGSARGQARMEIVLLIAPAIGVVLAYGAVILLLSSRKLLGIGVSRDGVHHWWWGGCSFYPWEDVRRVRPVVRIVPGVRLEYPKNSRVPGAPEESMLGRIGRYRRKYGSWLPLSTLDVHAVGAYQVLRFYQRNPELRGELGAEAALERVREGNFPDVIEELRKHGERGIPV